MFRSSPFTAALEAILSNENTPLLSIRGDKDQFTADSKYSQWEAKLGESAKSASFVKIEGADHFWSGKTHLNDMLAKVSEWLGQTGSNTGTSA